MSDTYISTATALPDRSTRLMVFGIFQILFGCLCGLMGLMMVLVSLAPVAGAPQGQAMNTQMMILALTVYLLLAVSLIWLGIGSIIARRWAWTLTVVLCWMWLVMGVIAFIGFVSFAGPLMSASIEQQMRQQGQGKLLPPEALLAVRIIGGAVLACIYIVLPALFLLFYQRASVRATCERRNPQSCWTDRCPMPVLALSVLLAYSAISMLSMPAYACVIPLFGSFVSGAAGAVIILLIAAALAYLAWGTYRLQMAAWWGTLLLWIVGTLNAAITFSRAGLIEMYEKMGMPPAQLEMMQKSGFIDLLSRWGPWMGLVGGLMWLGYLLYVRHYFVRHREQTTADV